MATIPLVALDSRAAQEQEGPLAAYLKMQQIKNAQLGQQTAQLQQTALGQENQQRELALQDQHTLRSLAPNHVVKDTDGNVKGYDMPSLLQEAAGKGVNPQTLTQMGNQYAESVKNLASANEAVRTNEQAKNKAMYETLESLRSIKDPAQRSVALQAALPSLQKQGVDVSKIGPNEPLDDKSLDVHEAALGVHAQILADAKTAAETARATQETATSKATQAHTEMETAQGGPPATRELNSYLAAHPGQTAADYEEHMKKIVPAFQFGLLNNTGAGQPAAVVAKQFGMTPVAFDQAAEKYWTSGVLPPAGRGGPALAMNKALMNRAAELHPEGSLAANSAEYKANAGSLTKLQANLDQVSAFENTAIKNLDMFTGLAKKAIDTGIPIVNAPLRTAAGLLGSKDQASFEAARQVAVNEIAKVTSSPGLTGQLSDTARKEVSSFIPESATVGQIMSLANTLKQDMANRHVSYQQQIEDIKGRLGGGASENNPKVAPSNTAVHTPGGEAPGLKEGQTGTGTDGKKYVVKGGKWQPQTTTP
jgi:hypothetical protein